MAGDFLQEQGDVEKGRQVLAAEHPLAISASPMTSLGAQSI